MNLAPLTLNAGPGPGGDVLGEASPEEEPRVMMVVSEYWRAS